MRITDVSLHRILIPLELPTVWIGGVDSGWARTVVRVRTDEGIEGIGETSSDDTTYQRLLALRETFRGKSPYEGRRLVQEMWQVPVQMGTSGMHALQAIETACWDLTCKVANLPLHQLLGGALRSSIPVIGYLHPRVATDDGRARDHLPDELVAHATAIAKTCGIRTLKMKGGVFAPSQEIDSLATLRAAFPDYLIRFDPNAFWSVATAARLGHELERLSLEWWEDPAPGIEGMRRTRSTVPIPIASNMCCVQPDQLASAIRSDAIDVLLLDIDDWGGLSAAMKAAATCETFGIGVGLHSSGEAGIATALNLQLAATLPTFPHAMDSYYHHQTADVITEPHRYDNGEMAVPNGPGLGVSIDDEALAKLEELFATPRRPVVDPTPRPRRPGLW